MVVIGEKGRAQLVRDRRKAIITTIQEVGKIRMTFTQVDASCLRRLDRCLTRCTSSLSSMTAWAGPQSEPRARLRLGAASEIAQNVSHCTLRQAVQS